MSVEIAKYYQEKIKLQTEQIKELTEEIELMSQHLIDLLDPNCPPEYREVVKRDLEKFADKD